MKSIIIAGGVIACAVLLWGASAWFAPEKAPPFQQGADISQPEETAATSTQEVVSVATSSEPIIKEQPKKEPARIMLTKTQFSYTITGTTPCGDKIGSFDVVSSDPAKELYWGMTGAMPIWLIFSAVEGKTPATVDMSYNCIMSGAEETIDWGFVIVEKTKEGKYVDGYYRSFRIEGGITKE